GHQPVYYIIALAVFALSSVAYMQALKFQRMAILEVFWGTMMALLVIGMGVLVYNEKIGVQEGVGIVLALTASVLLTVKF
ncbi:hypothetical protein KKC87_02180, partial [Patescibacteria group bacterium]|nr:hypothetical protein [Patescibacteria group bacterium]